MMPADFQEEMEALRRQYLTELAGRVSYLVAAARRLSGLGGPGDPVPDLGELRRMVHRLAGSAGIYGFRRISEKARAVDELLLGVIQDGQPLDDRAVASRLSELVQALDEAIAGSGGRGAAEDPGSRPADRGSPSADG